MPNLPQEATIVQYVANGSQTNFTFAFYAPENTDIQVYSQPQNVTPVPTEQILTLNVDYTVVYNSDPTTGGSINFVSAPASGNLITINLQIAASLNTNFANAQNFNGAALDAALDRLLLLCQQNLNYILQRNLSYVINSYLPTTNPFLPNANPQSQLPVLGSNQIWQGTGTGIAAVTLEENPNVGTLRSQLANSSPGTCGTLLIGYYDTLNNQSVTLNQFLNNLPENVLEIINSSSAPLIQNQLFTDSGSANALQISVTGYTQYKTGDTFTIAAAHTNTTTSTLQVNALGAKNIIVAPGINVYPSDIAVGIPETYVYNGTAFVLKNANGMLQRRSAFSSVYLQSSSQTFPASNTITKVTYDTVYSDSLNMWNASTHQWTIPFAGKWRITTGAMISAGDPSRLVECFVYQNGGQQGQPWGELYSSTSNPNIIGNGSVTLTCSAGDTIYIALDQGGSTPTTILNNGNATFAELSYEGQ